MVPLIWSHFDRLLEPRNRIGVPVCKKIRAAEVPIEHTERRVAWAEFYCPFDERRSFLRASDIDQFVGFLGVGTGEIGIEPERSVEGLQRRRVLALRAMNKAICEMCQSEVLIDRQGPRDCRLGLRELVYPGVVPAVQIVGGQQIGQPRPRLSRPRIEADGLFEKPARRESVLRSDAAD